MKKIALYIGFFLLLSPQIALAQTTSCSARGYTVVFVNGVFDTYQEALHDSNKLRDKLHSKYEGEAINIQLGYNPTHVGGLDDSVQAVFQQFNSSLSDFDLDTILMQIYPEVNTRKLLIVGHSQGADYANEMYSYLLAHGEPKEAVGVYAVATPASFVAGSGKYVTSTKDKVINWVRVGAASAGAQLPLPANVTLPLSSVAENSRIGGHSFTDDYLANASAQITDDIQSELAKLVPTDATATGDCFTPPDANVGYKTQQALLSIIDPTAVVLKVGTATTINAGAVALKTTATVVAGVFQFVADAITLGTAPPSDSQATQKTESIVNKLYGSSLDGLSPEDKKELLGTSQGGAVALAFSQNKNEPEKGLVEGTSTELEASSTQTDVPEAPAATTSPIFTPAPSSPTQSEMAVVKESSPADEEQDPIATSTEATTTESTTDEATTTEEVAPTPIIVAPTPPAIAINEIEWAGDQINPGREWIELKNLSSESIDMSDLAIVATEGGSQYIPLVGSIQPSGFFVVQRDSVAPLNPAANVALDFSTILNITPFEQLSDSGEQLALVQVGEWGTTTVDITPSVSACNGWCAGKTRENSGLGSTLSMERINSSTSGENPSNWASNDTYTASSNMPGGDGQPLYATVLAENSQHISQDFGWFCSPDKTPISDGQSYHVGQSVQCTYLARFIPAWRTNIMSGLFKGTVGSSTAVFIHNSWIGTSNQFMEGIDPATAQAGDQYFAAIWKVRTDSFPQPLDNVTFPLYFTTGERWARGSFDGPIVDTGDTNPPTGDFRVIQFTYQP